MTFIMETKIISGHKVSTFRKNNTKLVLSLLSRLEELLEQEKSLEYIRRDLEKILEAYKQKKSTRIYISYLGVSEWHERESLSIRDSGWDATLVNCRCV